MSVVVRLFKHAGYGFEIRNQGAADEGQRRADNWQDLARRLAEGADERPVLDLSHDEQKVARDKGIKAPLDKVLRREVRDAWCPNGGVLHLDKYQARFLTGGWMEVFFWNLLERQADALGIWDVRLGLEIGRIEDTTGNDFDVGFMHDHGLSMVECKSGRPSTDAPVRGCRPG